MFTGIIQSVGKLRQEKNILEIEILDNLFDMAIGDSIACLLYTSDAADDQ